MMVHCIGQRDSSDLLLPLGLQAPDIQTLVPHLPVHLPPVYLSDPLGGFSFRPFLADLLPRMQLALPQLNSMVQCILLVLCIKV